MAAKKTVNLITELECRYLECNICRELFDEGERIPRLLPCHHPFCSECLKKLDRRNYTIKCPTCNAAHKVKKNYPLDFPKDNTRRDLTLFLQTHTVHISMKTCYQCGNTVDVTFRCQQCDIDLCAICRCQHKTKNKTHNSIRNKSETFQEEDGNLDVCQNPHHKREKLKYFCNSSNCQSLLCPSCVVAEHRDISKHELEDIEEAFKKKKKQLGNDVITLQTQMLRVKTKMQIVIDKTTTLHNERNEFRRNVDAIYSKGMKVLEQRRQRLLNEYNIPFQREESKAVTRKDNLDSFLQNASECCSLSEQLINRNSMSSFLNVHQTIDVHVKQYLNTSFENSTCDEREFEKRINFDDKLRLFEKNVEQLEKSEEDEEREPLIELTKENHQDRNLKYLKNTFGTYIYTLLAVILSYLIHKAKHTVLFVLSKILMITNIPIMLRQKNNPENPKTMELHQQHANERQRYQDVRRLNRYVRHTKRAKDGRNLKLELLVMKQMQGYVVGFRDQLWSSILFLFMIIAFHEISVLPLGIRVYNNLAILKFNTQMTSQFACRSADNKTVATVPVENMVCGSMQRLFKYEGVFANTSFIPEKESSIEFSIRIQLKFLKSQKNEKLPFFEFGFSNDSISTKLLFPLLLSVSSVPCQSKLGVCLLTGSGVLIEGKHIFKSESNSHFVEGRFILEYRPSNFTFSLLSNFSKSKTTTTLHIFRKMKFRSPLWPVFAAYDFSKIGVSINIKTNEVVFDRNTLHQNLFISNDNKTMSNKKLSGTFPSKRFETPIIFMRPEQIGLSNVLQTIIDIDFVESNVDNTLFKIGFRVGKDKTLLLECTKCAVKNYFDTTDYCLSGANYANQIVVRNHLSFVLRLNKNGLLEMYVLDYFFGYTYISFPLFLSVRMTPEFYIEKVAAKDIAVSSKNSNILNLKRVCLCLFIGITLLIIKNRTVIYSSQIANLNTEQH